MRLRNISPLGVGLDVPLLRRTVEHGEDFEATPDQAERLLPSPNFGPADDEAALLDAQLQQPTDDQDDDEEDDQ